MSTAQKNDAQANVDIPLRPVTSPTSQSLAAESDDPQKCTTSKPASVVTPSTPVLPLPRNEDLEQPPSRHKSRVESFTVIITLAGVSFLNTMGSGILIGALPQIAIDVSLDEGFLLWPASVYALAAGCLLLIFGAIADVVGAKKVWLTGSFLYMVFTAAVGLARTGVQVILFRTLTGASIAMCLPAAVSLITNTFPKGTWRNVAFAANGMGQPLGFAVGLVLGGVFTDTIGWRWAYYVMALINLPISIAAIWALPSVHTPSEKVWSRRLLEDIDWVGALIMSAALGLLLYVLATTTSSYTDFSEPTNIALFVLSLVLLISFPFWMSYQVRHGRPAIIPNKLWKNTAFTATCVCVFFCWASMNAIQYFTTLYFQRVLRLSALQASIRFLPHIIMGASVNVVTGFIVSRVSIRTTMVVSAAITMAAPPVMATIDIDRSYWLGAFWGLLLSPVNPDGRSHHGPPFLSKTRSSSEGGRRSTMPTTAQLRCHSPHALHLTGS